MAQDAPAAFLAWNLVDQNEPDNEADRAVQNLVMHDAWLLKKIDPGLAAAEAGALASNEEVAELRAGFTRAERGTSDGAVSRVDSLVGVGPVIVLQG